ncbi:MAG: YigZ family protein [Treponema sp.]|nr:YigZ family protein [Treponema sp.]
MNILKEAVSSEFTVKGSRFLSELFPCESQAQAKELIKAQKAKYADSTHVVHAFVIGLSMEIMGMSDDGEPSGTAGRPALDVLKGHCVTNLLLTITRWFGGTLLGTGGLVKAYGDGAKQVLLAAEEKGLFEAYVKKVPFSFECDYTLYQSVKRFLDSLQISDLAEKFESQVSVSGNVPEADYQLLCNKIKDMSNGKIIL